MTLVHVISAPVSIWDRVHGVISVETSGGGGGFRASDERLLTRTSFIGVVEGVYGAMIREYC